MRGFVGAIIVVLIGVWGYNTFLKPASWQGMYEVSTSNTIGVVKFGSKEECQDWLEDPYYYAPRDAYNFECGSNCKSPETALGVHRCDETMD